MAELDEFAEALMGQLSVEIDEEKVIAELGAKIREDRSFTVEFDNIESVGISAGASTPDNIISKVIDKVKTISNINIKEEVYE